MNDSATDWGRVGPRASARRGIRREWEHHPHRTLSPFHAPDGAPSEGARARSDECVKRALVPERAIFGLGRLGSWFQSGRMGHCTDCCGEALELVGDRRPMHASMFM